MASMGNSPQNLITAPDGRTDARAGLTRPAIGALALVDLLTLVVAVVVFSFFAYHLTPYFPDDSYITYRYAEHLAAGQGITFNAGQPPVEGYSNFLWLLMLAGLARAGLALEPASAVAGGLLGALCVFLLWAILWRRGCRGLALAVPTGLLAISAPLMLYSISGMETPLFAALLLVCILAVDLLLAAPGYGRGLLLAVTGFLLALCRPEGIVAFPVLAGCLLLFGRWHESAGRRALWRSVLASAAVWVALLAAYHIWRVNYFGAWLPTPFLSKGGGGPSEFLSTWSTNVGQFFVRQTHYYAPFAYYFLALGLPAALGIALSWKRLSTRQVELAAFVLAVAYALVYFNFTDWMPGLRYYAPLAALLLIPFSLLADELRGQSDPAEPWREVLPFAALGAVLGVVSLFGYALVRMDAQSLEASTQSSLVTLGEWLADTMPADAVLAMSDVGATPYFSRLETVDINPYSLTDRHIAENGLTADYFFQVDPDVVILTAFSQTEPDFYGAHEELYALPRFRSTYERVGVTRNDWYQDRSYWVFLKKGVELTPEQLASFPQGIRRNQ